MTQPQLDQFLSQQMIQRLVSLYVKVLEEPILPGSTEGWFKTEARLFLEKIYEAYQLSPGVDSQKGVDAQLHFERYFISYLKKAKNKRSSIKLNK